MKLSLKIFIAILFIIFAKVVTDIYIVSNFLLKNEILYAYRCILTSVIGGFLLVYIYNIIQKKYNFAWAISYTFVCFISLPVASLFINRPFSNDIFLYLIPGYILFGNILMFLLTKGITLRISSKYCKDIERWIALSKSTGMLLVGLILIILTYFNSLSYADFEAMISYIYIPFALGFITLANAVITTPKANEAIENNQAVRVENSLLRLAQYPYFGILLLFGAGIGITLSLISDFYYTYTMTTYFVIDDCYKVFGYYVLIFVIGELGFEFFLRRKLMHYAGLKNNIKILPITIAASAIFLIAEYFIFRNNPVLGEEFKFIYFFILQLLMISGHFIFEKVSFPSTFSFLQPVNNNKCHDFFTKSFLTGITLGILLTFIALYYLRINFFGSSNIFHPFSIATAATILIIANIPLFKNYKHELQTILYKKSNLKQKRKNKKIEDLNKQDLLKLEEMQFLRFLNLLEIKTPNSARKKVLESLDSENNIFQRIALIKASNGQYLEGLSLLEQIQKTKYYKYSPNKDLILTVVNRFVEICYRMEQEKYITQLSISKKENERVFGAKLAYFSHDEEKEIILTRLLKDPELSVVKNTLISSIESDIKALIPAITNKMDHPALSNAAHAVLLSYDKKFLPEIEKMFYQTGQTEKVQLRIIQLYGEIADEETTEYLLKKINHSNQNIVSAVLEALSRCSIILSEEKTLLLKHELDEVLQILVWNTSFRMTIEKSDLSDLIKEAIELEIQSNFDNIFNLLSLLYDHNSIKLLRENLFSYNQEKITFSIELATILFTEDSMKQKIMPLIQPISDYEFLKTMEFHAPTETLSITEILYTLVQRDYKWIKQWTKACALNELIKRKDRDITSILLANMINSDTMLSELAAHALFKIDENIYFENKKIFKEAYTGLLDQTVLNKIENKSQEEDFPVLKFEIINFLKTIAEFSDIDGETLKNLASYILPINLQANEQFEYTDNIEIKSFHYFLYKGSVSLFINDHKIKTYVPGTFISSLDLLLDYEAEVKLISNEKSIVYLLSHDNFSEQLSQNDGIAESIIYNTKSSRYQEFEDLIKKRPLLKTQSTIQSINKLETYQFN